MVAKFETNIWGKVLQQLQNTPTFQWNFEAFETDYRQGNHEFL